MLMTMTLIYGILFLIFTMGGGRGDGVPVRSCSGCGAEAQMAADFGWGDYCSRLCRQRAMERLKAAFHGAALELSALGAGTSKWASERIARDRP